MKQRNAKKKKNSWWFHGGSQENKDQTIHGCPGQKNRIKFLWKNTKPGHHVACVKEIVHLNLQKNRGKDFKLKPTTACSHEDYCSVIKGMKMSFSKLGHVQCKICECFTCL